MIYEYTCLNFKCQNTFEVYKTFAEKDRGESCPKCSHHAARHMAPSRIQINTRNGGFPRIVEGVDTEDFYCQTKKAFKERLNRISEQEGRQFTAPKL